MCVDVVDVGGLQASQFQGFFHSTKSTFAVGRRCGLVKGVAGIAVARQQRLWLNATTLGALGRLEYQISCALAQV